ncbi:hypothetical protein PIB30_005301 [Stylosanthes scabra]|uniref:RRM domain-containing protein n=1 Tax=Stylosanthes scabra TaxID=79078 RepID=A0ABU6U3F0_9FABA|nr:hypothetical protein [Stylosanthes scabra]
MERNNKWEWQTQRSSRRRSNGRNSSAGSSRKSDWRDMERKSYIVFVDGLPTDIAKRMMFKIFRWVGGVNDTYVSRMSMRGSSCPFAFVKFDSRGGAKRAMKLNGTFVGTRKLEVKLTEFKRRLSSEWGRTNMRRIPERNVKVDVHDVDHGMVARGDHGLDPIPSLSSPPRLLTSCCYLCSGWFSSWMVFLSSTSIDLLHCYPAVPSPWCIAALPLLLWLVLILYTIQSDEIAKKDAPKRKSIKVHIVPTQVEILKQSVVAKSYSTICFGWIKEQIAEKWESLGEVSCCDLGPFKCILTFELVEVKDFALESPGL